MQKSLIEVFSFWIFIWFVFYYFNLIPFNPLFFLLLSSFFIIITAISILSTKQISNYNKFKYAFINISMKLIPILLIIKFPLVIYTYDIYFGIFLFIIYIIIMKLMHINIMQTYKELYLSNLNDDYKHHRGVLSRYYDHIYDSYIKNIYQ